MKIGTGRAAPAATRRGDDRVRRRRVIAGVAALLFAPRQAAAQQAAAKIPRVGWVWTGRSAGNPFEVTGFRQGLREFGYIEGQNILIEYRFGEGRRDRIADLVSELVERQLDVLV